MPHGRSSSKDEQGDPDYYERRYKEDKERQHCGHYGLATLKARERQEQTWREYCKMLNMDHIELLLAEDPGRFYTYLYFDRRETQPKGSTRHLSSFITYWRQLSQVFIKYAGRRIKPEVSRQVYEFLKGDFVTEEGLDTREADKPLLDPVDFRKVLRCHWATDNNTYPDERQRVQVAALLLLAAATGSRPHALLEITYEDLRLFVTRDTETQTQALTLEVTLAKTKSAGKRAQAKSYSFYLSDDPTLCIVSYVMALAYDDGAFWCLETDPGLVTLRKLLELQVIPGGGLNDQKIPSDDSVRKLPVFRAPRLVGGAQGERSRRALGTTMYQRWLKRLGEATGLKDTLTTYCLRRAVGNAINDDPSSSDVGLCPQQTKEARQDPDLQDLYKRRDLLRKRLEESYRPIAKGYGDPDYAQYQQVIKEIDRVRKSKERALRVRRRAEYDEEAPKRDFRAQMVGEDISVLPCPVLTRYAFVERARIANALRDSDNPTTDDEGDILERRVAFVQDLAALCARRERGLKRSRRVSEDSSSDEEEQKEDEDSEDYNSASTAPDESARFPICCLPLQCLFCLGDVALSTRDRLHNYYSRDALERHFRCHHEFKPGQSCPFPSEKCAQTRLEHVRHFKKHAQEIHHIVMSDRC